MEQVIDVPEQEVITKDNATVTVDGLAFFQVFDAAKASYEVASLEQAIIKLTMTNIRSVMGAMDLDQMLSHRDEINERLLRVVDAAVAPWGVKVNRIEIKDIVPPADLIQSMGRQMKAERDKRAEILTAEGQRQSAILKAEGAKQAQILEAEGRREAAFRDAEARERSAAGRGQGDRGGEPIAISHGDVAALNYFIADKYIRAFSDLARSPNQKVLMMPIEATAVLGSLAGIAEIAKGCLRGPGGSGGPPVPGAGADPAAGRGLRPVLRDCRSRMPAVATERQGTWRTPVDVELPRFRSAIWDWFIAGGVLLILEILAPGVFMLWLGLAALLVGVDLAGGGLAVAGAIRRLRGVLGRRDSAVAAARAGRSDADRPAVPQPPRRGLCRARVHPGKADRRRLRHHRHRRHGVARRRRPTRPPAAGQGHAGRRRGAPCRTRRGVSGCDGTRLIHESLRGRGARSAEQKCHLAGGSGVGIRLFA